MIYSLDQINLNVNENFLAFVIKALDTCAESCRTLTLGQVLIATKRGKCRSHCHTLAMNAHVKRTLDRSVESDTIANHTDFLAIVESHDPAFRSHQNLLKCQYVVIMHPNGSKVKPFTPYFIHFFKEILLFKNNNLQRLSP